MGPARTNPLYLAAGVLLFAACAGAQAQVYRCKTGSGATTYSDRPCPESPPIQVQGQGPKELPPRFVPTSGSSSRSEDCLNAENQRQVITALTTLPADERRARLRAVNDIIRSACR